MTNLHFEWELELTHHAKWDGSTIGFMVVKLALDEVHLHDAFGFGING
jgi:hypothetical protein